MGTVDKDFADNIARNDGYHDGDSDNSLGDNPRCVLIVRYINAWGKAAYGLVFEGQPNPYAPSGFVRNPVTYWEYGVGWSER